MLVVTGEFTWMWLGVLGGFKLTSASVAGHPEPWPHYRGFEPGGC